MRKLILSLSFLMLFDIAHAGTAVVNWNAPVQREDGTALLPGELASYKVQWGNCTTAGGLVSVAGELTVGNVLTATVTGLSAGEKCFRVFAVTASGVSSAASNVLSKIVPESPPKPPVLVTVATTAYVIQPGWLGMLRMVAVKDVKLPLGMACESVVPGLSGYGIAAGFIAQCRAG